MTSARTKAVLAIALVLGLGNPSPTFGLSFTPSDVEWTTWPDYCKARYVVSGAGRKSRFVDRVSSAEIEMHRQQMGEQAWHWLHHHCAGLVFLSRAVSEANRRGRENLLDRARGNVMGQYARTPRGHWFFPEVAITLAQISRSQGDTQEALNFLSQSMDSHPGYASAYSLASIIHRHNGDVDTALQVLITGNNACNGTSAEIHYFLGLIYLDKEKLELATEHATKAYRLGYPLTGLKERLEKLGQRIGA